MYIAKYDDKAEDDANSKENNLSYNCDLISFLGTNN